MTEQLRYKQEIQGLLSFFRRLSMIVFVALQACPFLCSIIVLVLVGCGSFIMAE